MVLLHHVFAGQSERAFEQIIKNTWPTPLKESTQAAGVSEIGSLRAAVVQRDLRIKLLEKQLDDKARQSASSGSLSTPALRPGPYELLTSRPGAPVVLPGGSSRRSRSATHFRAQRLVCQAGHVVQRQPSAGSVVVGRSRVSVAASPPFVSWCELRNPVETDARHTLTTFQAPVRAPMPCERHTATRSCTPDVYCQQERQSPRTRCFQDISQSTPRSDSTVTHMLSTRSITTVTPDCTSPVGCAAVEPTDAALDATLEVADVFPTPRILLQTPPTTERGSASIGSGHGCASSCVDASGAAEQVHGTPLTLDLCSVTEPVCGPSHGDGGSRPSRAASCDPFDCSLRRCSSSCSSPITDKPTDVDGTLVQPFLCANPRGGLKALSRSRIDSDSTASGTGSSATPSVLCSDVHSSLLTTLSLSPSIADASPKEHVVYTPRPLANRKRGSHSCCGRAHRGADQASPSTPRRKPDAGTSGASTALRCLSLGRSRGAAQHGASDVAGKAGQDCTANPSVKGSTCLPSRVSSARAWR
uniref:Uncharacterized protein n=1 Tax=Noctiluca scintillans TaxID=2966 RepID=A0A7S1A4B0_NOCSC|mmetsp:Transcript_30160/g.80475  ORF Transcript_30160/g.80475 Transcript_30160/m.80475 type:complete len:530 (+) Transcript_30160:58-1647(+)